MAYVTITAILAPATLRATDIVNMQTIAQLGNQLAEFFVKFGTNFLQAAFFTYMQPYSFQLTTL